MRTIDADKLRAYFVDLAKDRDYGFGDVGRMIAVKIEHIVDTIDKAPTIEVVPKDFHDKTCEAMAQRHQEEIADMVRVVRCKDCIVFKTHGKNKDICPMWHNTHIDPYRDFCSRGKRREP